MGPSPAATSRRDARSERPGGVVCDDRAVVRRRVSTQLERVGIALAGEADSFVPLLQLVLRTSPDVAVVTLPLVGTSGMTAVSALRAASPGCEVVILSALGNLEVAAHEAGALAVLAEDDARALSEVLSALVRRSRLRDLSTAPPQAAPPVHEDCAEPTSTSAGSAGSPTTKPAS